MAASIIGDFARPEQVQKGHVYVLQKRPQSEDVKKAIDDIENTSDANALKEKLKNNFAFVQFHPGYDYTDFVEGLKPELEGKEIAFKRRLGIFGELCRKASEKENEKFVILIDEINRADLSRVLGELFVGLEKEYRGIPIDTQYSTMRLDGQKEDDEPYKLAIPSNLYIIGTMNDIDRSVESMDFALRRRFAWLEVTAESSELILNSAIDDIDIREELLQKMRALNDVIIGKSPLGIKVTSLKLGDVLGKDYQLGGAYFAKYKEYAQNGQKPKEAYASLWKNHIRVILTEYLRTVAKSDRDKILAELQNIYDNPVKSKNAPGKNAVPAKNGTTEAKEG